MDTNQAYSDVIKMSYGYFANRACTPEALVEYLQRMGPWLEAAGVDADEAYAELERLHTIAMLDSASVLVDHGDHEEWFNPSTNDGLQRHIDWHFWDHFESYLIARKNWPKVVVESLDRESSMVLSHLEDPRRPGPWDRRGMVMGSVQSGKTANYTGLICKAIDSGYRLIVVLAGVHNSLRSQTQSRLNEEVLGYSLEKVQEFRGQTDPIGVRSMFSDHRIAQTLTNSSEQGDFRKNFADQAGIIPSSEGPATILIIKKHVSILKNLIDWSTGIIGQSDDTGRRVVTDVPLLVIDDECDYASVNTRKVTLNEDGLVDEESDPAKTNMRIRELLNAFRKSAYVGYTATPFANIFIHHDQVHAKYGEDLFPRNFIVSLPQPDNYIGPERVFGLVDNPSAGIVGRDGSALVRYVDDSEGFIPTGRKSGPVVAGLPPSLEEAIRAFLISAAVRRLRGTSVSHNSMLIHVTRLVALQGQVQTLVERSLRSYVDRIRSGSDPLEDFRAQWEEDFVPTTASMDHEPGAVVHGWEEVRENLYPVARRVRVGLINGTSADTLAYRNVEASTRQRELQGESVPWEERGEQVIAIGGDKLSRGLTLDGLSVSYYLRVSSTYDTLMQMGRWFGYRDRYLDVCRIYTTKGLADWYRFIASASLELRQELKYMALIKEEPKNFGLKVLDHPGQLAVTSAGKSRNAEVIKLSYSGRISETVVFDLSHSAANRDALSRLMEEAGDRVRPASRGAGAHWTGVPPGVIVRYLRSYRTHEEAARVVNPELMAKFIEQQQDLGTGDLSEWDVVVLSKEKEEASTHTMRLNGKEFHCLERTPRTLDDRMLTIGRLVSPTDEWVDFSDSEKDDARKEWDLLRAGQGKEPPAPDALPSGPAIRAARPEKRGLLLIYPICANGRYGTDPGEEVTGFAISFPTSKTTLQVQYMLGTVAIEQGV